MKRFLAIIILATVAILGSIATAVIQRQQSSTNYPMVFFLTDAVDHTTGKTGLTPVVTLSKNGGTFAAAVGAVSELGSGWYVLDGNATDRNTLGPLIVHAEGTGADPADLSCEIVTYDPYNTLTIVGTDANAAHFYAQSADGKLDPNQLELLNHLDVDVSTRLPEANYIEPNNAAILAAAADANKAAQEACWPRPQLWTCPHWSWPTRTTP